MDNILNTLSVKIYADGADKVNMVNLYNNSLIKGLTTNPTLMKKAGITNYEYFAKDILETVTDKPISFEVFSDEFPDMYRQALKIAAWQENVYVKIPIKNTKNQSSINLIKELSNQGIKLNITAIMTISQLESLATVINSETPSITSIFAGRIADTGKNPIPIVSAAHSLLATHSKNEILWASVREVYNIFQANQTRCHIVTVPHEILNKAMSLIGKDLEELSLDTVKMFYNDSVSAGFSL
jgi:transaldolase